FSSRRRHTRSTRDWSSDVCSSDLYEIPNVRFKTTTVLTNTTTVGAYRGAGRPEATQLIERVLDVAADQMGMDPAEVRRVNFIQQIGRASCRERGESRGEPR